MTHVPRQDYEGIRGRRVTLTLRGELPKIRAEVHAGWCSPRTSNPVVPIISGRSVRFRHTSATTPCSGVLKSLGLLVLWHLCITTLCSHESKKAQAISTHNGGQAPGTIARRLTSRGANPPGQTKEAAQTQKARAAARDRDFLVAHQGVQIRPQSILPGRLGPSLVFRLSPRFIFRDALGQKEKCRRGGGKQLGQGPLDGQKVGFAEAFAGNLHVAIRLNEEERRHLC